MVICARGERSIHAIVFVLDSLVLLSFSMMVLRMNFSSFQLVDQYCNWFITVLIHIHLSSDPDDVSNDKFEGMTPHMYVLFD